MAVVYVNKVITLAGTDAITDNLVVKGIHVRRNAAGTGVVEIYDGSDTTKLYSVELPGNATTTSPNGYFISFGPGGMRFDGGLAAHSASMEMSIFLA